MIRTRLSLAAAAALLALAPLAQADNAAKKPAPNMNSAVAQQERERCLSGQSGQDQATCLREVGAARQAEKNGQLNESNERFNRNAMERCKSLPADEAKDCRDRVMGEGKVSGSVKGGGVLKETTTIEVKPMATTPATPSSTSTDTQTMVPAPAPTK